MPRNHSANITWHMGSVLSTAVFAATVLGGVFMSFFFLERSQTALGPAGDTVEVVKPSVTASSPLRSQNHTLWSVWKSLTSSPSFLRLWEKHLEACKKKD